MNVGLSDMLWILAISSILLISYLADLVSDAFISICLYPQWWATTRAKVVLPHPGGPDNKISLLLSISFLNGSVSYSTFIIMFIDFLFYCATALSLNTILSQFLAHVKTNLLWAYYDNRSTYLLALYLLTQLDCIISYELIWTYFWTVYILSSVVNSIAFYYCG